MRKLSCIIFDIDGTLAETNALISATFNYVSEKYLNRHFTPHEITGMFGPPEEVVIERLVGTKQSPIAMADFFDFYERSFRSLAKLHSGILDILKFLKEKKIILAVFTGKGSRSTDITLAELGIRQYFDLVVTGHNVTNHKPSSEGIETVVEHFRLGRDEVLMIGDSVSDVKAAHEAGIPIAAVVWDSYSKEKVMGMETDFLFRDVKELHYWLTKTLQEG